MACAPFARSSVDSSLRQDYLLSVRHCFTIQIARFVNLELFRLIGIMETGGRRP